MDRPLKDRRLHARFRGPVLDRIRAVLRPGHVVALVNLSARGALLEGARPLRPGSRVHLQLQVAERRYALAGEVLRCGVASLDAGGVQYRGALKFDTGCSLWEVESDASLEASATPRP